MFTRSDRLRPNTTFNRFLGTESDKSLIDDLYLTESCKHESKLVLRSAEGKLLSDDFNHADSNVTHPPTQKPQNIVNKNHQKPPLVSSQVRRLYNTNTHKHDVPTRPNQLSIWSTLPSLNLFLSFYFRISSSSPCNKIFPASAVKYGDICATFRAWFGAFPFPPSTSTFLLSFPAW